MQQINLYGEKRDGKLEIRNRVALDQWINNLPEGEKVVIKFNVSKNYKTFRQIRLAYACFRFIMEKTGYELEEVKYLVKKNQGLCACHTIEGEQVIFCKSLSDFSKEELSNFILLMDKWSTEKLNLPLLSHEDIDFLKN